MGFLYTDRSVFVVAQGRECVIVYGVETSHSSPFFFSAMCLRVYGLRDCWSGASWAVCNLNVWTRDDSAIRVRSVFLGPTSTNATRRDAALRTVANLVPVSASRRRRRIYSRCWLFAVSMLSRRRDCPVCGRSGCVNNSVFGDSYLVDSASSHMLVSKIKPCMSKYKPH